MGGWCTACYFRSINDKCCTAVGDFWLDIATAVQVPHFVCVQLNSKNLSADWNNVFVYRFCCSKHSGRYKNVSFYHIPKVVVGKRSRQNN